MVCGNFMVPSEHTTTDVARGPLFRADQGPPKLRPPNFDHAADVRPSLNPVAVWQNCADYSPFSKRLAHSLCFFSNFFFDKLGSRSGLIPCIFRSIFANCILVLQSGLLSSKSSSGSEPMRGSC